MMPDRFGDAPTPGQLECLRAYCHAPTQKEAAHRKGIRYQTFKNSLSGLYERLGVGGAIEAMAVLGWIVPPDEGTCGWLGRCSRHPDHRGQHGGFRAVRS